MDLLFYVFAFVCFVLATAWTPAKVNLIAAGLAFWVATFIF